MSRLKTRAATLLACLLVSFGAVAVQASPAMAVGCYASGCTGKDPQVQGCSPDAIRYAEFTYGARFELRVSYACWAAWTRVTSTVHYNTIFGQVRANNGKVFGVQATQGQHWTKMINFDNLVRSCRSIWFDADPIECTGWY